jgi:adenylate cyclase
LRVGLVWGRVLSRLGDVFGPSVSLASRLCNQAGPGRVLVDEPTAALLPGFLTEPLGVRELAGIGQTRPVLLVAETARDEEPLTPGR